MKFTVKAEEHNFVTIFPEHSSHFCQKNPRDTCDLHDKVRIPVAGQNVALLGTNSYIPRICTTETNKICLGRINTEVTDTMNVKVRKTLQNCAIITPESTY